jgi:hypothetical protein
VLLRLACLTVTNIFAVLRLLPVRDRDKDVEILVLRHQIAVLERQLGERKVRFTLPDRALLAALLHRLRPEALRRMRLLVRPDTVLRWHRERLGRIAGAVSVLPPSVSRDPPAAPGVRLSPHRALHVSCPDVSSLVRLTVSGSTGSVCCHRGSGSASP